MSLEYADDVAIHAADGKLVILEQAKSSLSGNPASDRSEQLWKTFANWAEGCEEGIDPSTTAFVIYITPAKTGDLVLALNAAVSIEDASAALTRVKALLNRNKPEVGCNPFLIKFLSAGDSVCTQIIRHFTIVTEQDPIESLRQQLRSVISGDLLDDFCSAAIGIAREHADELIRQGQTAIVSASDFRKQFHAFVRKYDLLGLLISTATKPTKEAIRAIVDTAPMFVRQLEAVDATQDLLVTAVSDYLRTISDKVTWADECVVVANSFDELDSQLERQHTISRDEIEDLMSSKSEATRGRALYRKCTAIQLPLEGRSLPSHFIAGAYNCLADCRRLGWHPHYQTLFPDN
ncbi:MAG: hypothetical protein EKK42_35105 [Pseudonocardiaceae bacterium]|nr:MAG: hypothetical protein EKK42_35105 [Pseudonocardiaceae bacterium]